MTRPAPIAAHRSSSRSRRALAGLACLAGLSLSCASTGGSSAPGPEAKGDEAAEELDDARFAVHEAELDLQKERLEAAGRLAEAKAAVMFAERALEQAQRERKAFDADRLLRLDSARLSWDRAIGRARDAELELAELEAMYAEEEFAEKTKELVLTRGRRDLDHAKRGLQLEERRYAQLTDTELPSEEHDLDTALRKAEDGLREARLEQDVAEIETKLAIEKAERALAKARKELEEKEADA